MSETLPNPWERRLDDGESSSAYEALRAYLDLGPQRSHEKTRLTLGKTAGYIRVIAEWSSKWDWVKRAVAWDAHVRAIVDEHSTTRRLQLLDREWGDYERFLDEFDELVAATPLHKTIDVQTINEGTPEEERIRYVALNIKDWRDIVGLRAQIGDQGRRAAGLPEKVTQTQLTGNNGGAVQVDNTHRVPGLDAQAERFRALEAKLTEWKLKRKPDGDA